MKVFLIAGEPSGDRLAAALIAGLRQINPDIEFQGIAGPEMQQAGMDSLFPMSDLSLMGIAEILPKYQHLKRRIAETVAAVGAWHPDVLITVDSPDFCLRVAKQVRADHPEVRTVHYVAPTVWAWRPGRAKKMSHFIDHVLALFPFEPPFMHDAGMECDFVGHPVATISDAKTDELAAFWNGSELDPTAKTLAVLPGSRRSEIDRLMPRFVQVLQAAEYADLQLVFPTLPHLADKVSGYVKDLPQRSFVQTGAGRGAAQAARDRHVAYTASDLALAASGTVSLELAAAGTPMVIAYDMAFLSRLIIGAMLRVDTVTLVNLVTDTRVVPECIGKHCTVQNISRALNDVLRDPSDQAEVLSQTMHRLGRGGDAPGLRAARAVLDRM